jgi:hypothetical protein
MPEDIQEAHPFLPAGWMESQKKPILPDYNAISEAEKKANEAISRIRQSLGVLQQQSSGDKNINIIIARLNRVEQQILGASISCSGSTITLTWGA